MFHKRVMKLLPSLWSRSMGARAFFLVLTLLAWVSALVLASSPRLHEQFHPGARTPNHHCFITDLQTGSLLAYGTAAIVVAFVCGAIAWINNLNAKPVFAPEFRISLSRGPPRIPSIQVAG
jgi:hypothetical protein